MSDAHTLEILQRGVHFVALTEPRPCTGALRTLLGSRNWNSLFRRGKREVREGSVPPEAS
jgi:hypothetical protein